MAIDYVEVRTVRIMCDFILKDHVLKDVVKLGAAGYTWGDAQGAGEHDFLGNHFAGPERVWIEVWCNSEMADEIVEHFEQDAYRHIAIVVGVQPIWVHPVHSYKFTKKRA